MITSQQQSHLRSVFLLASAFVLLTTPVRAADTEEGIAFFEARIRPVLVKHCYECHSAKADDLQGGLLLDSKAGLRKGGDIGPAVVPKSLENSLLYEAISYKNRDLQMPPENRLPDSVVKDFRKWIEMGAPDPRVKPTANGAAPVFDLAARKAEHWAWQPIRNPAPDATIDRYIAEGLKKNELTASPRAAPHVLIRRVSFDLIGLPPTPEEVREFERDSAIDAAAAYRGLVDRLLKDPRFGEHWARHWLDVMRYCETKGHVTDQIRPHAWKYRDYVIQSLNDDLPYDRFVIEHLAGDLLPKEQHRPGPQGETNVTATPTGALFMHEMHFMAVDPIRQRWDEINAQIDVVSKAFLGLTLECARCHDHKFDAISHRDYYALAGFFYSTEQGRARTAPRQPIASANLGKVTKLEKDLNSYLERQRQGRRNAQAPKANGEYFPVSEELGIQAPGHTKTLLQKMNALSKADPSWSNWVRAATDVKGQDVPLLIRGEHRTKGKIIPRRFLTALSNDASTSSLPDKNGSGRLWLAEQIVDPDNPLTSRVWVNRLWHHLFGRGIVATPNNFGKLGATPSHPELLDYLATQLIESGWSTKTIIREIVLSQTYQQSSQRRSALITKDPENKLLARQNRRRLTAEQLRDAMLTASGSLDETMYGPSVPCFVPPYATANKPGNIPKSGPLDGNNRRSIYLTVRRNFYDPFLMTFDFPDRGHSVGRRHITLVPGQALAMLNSPLVHELSRDWGERLAERDANFEERVRQIWLTALSRVPTDAERKTMQQLAKELQTDSAEATQLWQHIAHVVFNHPDFAWLD